MIAMATIALTKRVIYGKFAVERCDSAFSCSKTFVRCIKKAKIVTSAINIGCRSVFSSLTIEMDADKSSFVVPLYGFVAAIIRIRSLAQFGYSVVVSDAETVINTIIRPDTVKMAPRKDVSKVVSSFSYLNVNVPPFLVERPSRFTGISRVPFFWHIGPMTPCKQASQRIVVKNRSYEFCSQRLVSWHEAFLLLWATHGYHNMKTLAIGG